MIYKILAKFFGSDDLGRYTPHPFHVVIYPICLMAAGMITILKYGENWYAFGLICVILGASLGAVIILAIGWEKSIDYWQTINEHIQIMMKVKDPDIFAALGYKKVPSEIIIKETKDHGQGMGQTTYKKVPASPAVLNLVANKVVSTNNFDFTAELYGNIVPNWRKFHQSMKENGYLVPKNKKNVRNGYRLNRKGYEFMYEYASEAIKLERKKGGNNV